MGYLVDTPVAGGDNLGFEFDLIRVRAGFDVGPDSALHADPDELGRRIDELRCPCGLDDACFHTGQQQTVEALSAIRSKALGRRRRRARRRAA